MTQERQANYRNPAVDQRFDFYTLGNNFRNSDIHAFIGKLDMKRIGVYRCQREFLYTVFRDTLNKLRVLDKFILPSIKTYIFGDGNFPFCIPIILSENNPEMSSMLLKFAATLGVETRPICTGNIVRQTPFMENYKPDEYPNSEHLHNNGFYIGLHAKIDVSDVKVVAEKFAKSVLAYNKR
jgi:CDP-6-deoxy-D-xylo-4-hexulose-3-dehydrase